MSLKDFLKDAALSGFKSTLRRLEDNVSVMAEKVADRVSHYIMRQLMSALLVIAATILLMLAGVFFLIEYLGLSNTLAFLLGGLVLLVIGLILRMKR